MKYFLQLLFVISLSPIVSAQRIEHQLDSLFTNLHAQGKFNGNVLIAEKGNVIYKKGFGFSDEITRQALTENTVFELAPAPNNLQLLLLPFLNTSVN